LRPVNLIPTEQRRAVRGEGTSLPTNVLVLLGGLGVALVAVLALVLISNQVNSKEEELADVSRKQQAAQAAAEALKPYGDFVTIQQSRLATVTALENSRFNWERVVRQLSHVIAPGVWVSTMKGTVSPGTGEGGGGARASVQGPAIELKGCAPSQETVARMMSHMRDLDGATEVVTSRSEKATGDTAGAAAAGSGSGGAEGCGSNHYEFELVVGLTGSSTAAAAAAGPGAAASAAAQTAAAQSSGATGSTGATGATGGTP
jgi:Tfp pilus assembly protein PilN